MTPIPVVTIADPIECHLPDLPQPFEIVGMASPDGIVITKSDAANIATYVMAQTAWIRAAAACISPASAVQP